MRIPGKNTTVWAGRWLRSRFRRRAMILGYHRLDDAEDDPFGLAVPAEVFRRHLQAVRRTAHPVRLSELVRDLRDGTVTSGAVALTFDDAYADTMASLEPILGEYEIPATVFVPTAYLGNELWWDRLRRIVFADCVLPPMLELPSAGAGFRRSLRDSEREPSVPGGRYALLTALYDLLSPLTPEVRQQTFIELESWTGGIPRPADARVVSSEGLKALGHNDLIEIGSHSATHPFMGQLPEAEQWHELESSKTCLENLLGVEVNLFSYPNGSYSPESERLLRRAGYDAACSSQLDVVTGASNVFRLPRHWPDGDPGSVTRVLERWLTR